MSYGVYIACDDCGRAGPAESTQAKCKAEALGLGWKVAGRHAVCPNCIELKEMHG